MKVSELTGTALDYWVAKIEGLDIELGQDGKFHGSICDHTGEDWYHFSPSTQWHFAGPIIEREGIAPAPVAGKIGISMWSAWLPFANTEPPKYMYGGTALEAAMRAYVASKFGEEVADE